MSQWFLAAFRLIYLFASVASGLLVLASILLSDTPGTGGQFILVSVCVSVIAFGLAALLAGIRHHAAALAKALRDIDKTDPKSPAKAMSRLVACLLATGAGVLAVMLILSLGAITRIGEGAAVFG